MPPSQGEIFWNGKKLYQDISFIPNMGLLLENVGLYAEFTGFQNLRFLAKINHKIGDAEIRQAIERSDWNQPISVAFGNIH